MQTERQREAADIRAHGQQQAQTIRAKADREATVIVADATRQADELRGQGDGEKNRILAEAFGRDPDFFAFYRSMQAYENGLRQNDTRLVLSPNSELLPLLQRPVGTAAARRSRAEHRRAGEHRNRKRHGALTGRRAPSVADLAAAFGLALALEGLLCASCPDAVRRAMAETARQPRERLRLVGIAAAFLGAAVVWAARAGGS